ncbi:MAG: integrase arm-type DNA-binding domain-containing protein [Proteobacteria bacterium]|nr:integrase arm-type DNA-binding domain-containing protein [Pseudomonadota bacterium]
MKQGLSARSVQVEKRPGYHRYGPGLYLQIASGGTKAWIFRFKSPVTGKQREMGLGSLGILSLAKARERAIECRQQMLTGADPIEERKSGRRFQQLEQARAITFRQAAEQCIDSKKHEWKNAKHAQQWVNTLTTHAYPTIGKLSVAALDTSLVLKVLEPIWVTKAETASRVRQRIETVWDWAKARGYVAGENPARLRGHLDKLLPKTSKIKRVKHHAALPYKNINPFVSALRKQKGSAPLALEFLILTAGRTSEITGATWSEIDLSAKVWTVPATRMKAGEEHRVPLCDRAIEILSSINTKRHLDEFVFPGWKTRTGLSNGAMLVLLGKMKFGQFTAHGFRSTFRDWAAEEAHGFQNETIELALAHTIKNQVERAYRRGDQLDIRRKLMGEWGRYVEIDQTRRKGNVLALKRRGK